MTDSSKKDCVFCKIICGDISSDHLYESDDLIVINDINPSADKHVLIVTKEHIPTFENLEDKHNTLFLEMRNVAQKFIKDLQITHSYKLIFNGGKFLEVHHLHWHLMGGNFKKDGGA